MAGESRVLPNSEPDPTVRVMETVNAEVRHLRELMEAKIMEEKVLCEEKFRSVDDQLALVERQRVENKADATATRLETKTDMAKALDAALVAQKDQAAAQALAFSREFTKSELATSKQIEQQAVNTQTEIGSLRASIDDLKLGLTKIESLKQGGVDARAAMYALVGFVVSLIVIGGFAAAWPR